MKVVTLSVLLTALFLVARKVAGIQKGLNKYCLQKE